MINKFFVSILITVNFLAAMNFSNGFTSHPRALLFDIDGTLSDSFRLGFESTQKVLVNNGYKLIDENEYHQGTRYTTPARFSWHSTGNPDPLAPVGIELGRQFDDMYVKLVSPTTAPLYEGIKNMIYNIKSSVPNLKIGALSNACGSYVEAVIFANQLENDFSVALGADQVTGAKPKPDGLLRCCEVLKVPPQCSLYIGDSPTDGQAAAAAGMPSIGVTWGSHSAQTVKEHFTYTVDTVQETPGDKLPVCVNEELPDPKKDQEQFN